MASRDKKDLDTRVAQALEMAIARFKEKHPTLPQPFLTCAFRPDEEQNLDYAKGRTSPGKIVTNARAGQSPHNFKPSYAFDIAFTDSRGGLDWSHDLFEKFQQCVQEISSVMVWGYDWNGNGKKDKNDFDAPHWELKDWKKYINPNHV